MRRPLKGVIFIVSGHKIRSKYFKRANLGISKNTLFGILPKFTRTNYTHAVYVYLDGYVCIRSFGEYWVSTSRLGPKKINRLLRAPTNFYNIMYTLSRNIIVYSVYYNIRFIRKVR